MNVEPLPRHVYRVHNNSIGPLEPPPQTGGFRFDDFRGTAARFYVLYTGHDPETCMAEKLQLFAAGDDEARAIVDAIPDIKGDTALPPPNRVSQDFLNQLAVSRLVGQDERSVVEICGRQIRSRPGTSCRVRMRFRSGVPSQFTTRRITSELDRGHRSTIRPTRLVCTSTTACIGGFRNTAVTCAHR